MPANPMGHIFTTYSHVGVRDLRNKVRVSSAIDPEDNKRVFTAIWDTGATHTSISRRVSEELGLRPTGRMEMRGVNRTKEVNTYKVNLVLPNNVRIEDLTVPEVSKLGSAADLLIGMNVISLGNFVVSTHQGITSFSFQCPSNRRIDLLLPVN